MEWYQNARNQLGRCKRYLPKSDSDYLIMMVVVEAIFVVGVLYFLLFTNGPASLEGKYGGWVALTGIVVPFIEVVAMFVLVKRKFGVWIPRTRAVVPVKGA